MKWQTDKTDRKAVVRHCWDAAQLSLSQEPPSTELGTGSHVYTTSPHCLVTAAWTWGKHLTKVELIQFSGPGIWNSDWELSWSVYVLKSQEQGLGVGGACHMPPCGQGKQESQSEEKREWSEQERTRDKGAVFWEHSSPWAQPWLMLSFISTFPRVPWAPPAAL